MRVDLLSVGLMRVDLLSVGLMIIGLLSVVLMKQHHEYKVNKIKNKNENFHESEDH